MRAREIKMSSKSFNPRNENTFLNSGKVKEINPIILKINPKPKNTLSLSLCTYISQFYQLIKLTHIPLNTSFPVSQIHLATAGQGIRVKTTCGFSFFSHTFTSLKEKLNSSPQVFIFFGVLV